MDKDKKGKKGLKCYTKKAPISGKIYTTCNADAQQDGSKKPKKRRLVLKTRPKSVEGQRPPPPRPPPPKPTAKDLADEALRKGSIKTAVTKPRRLKLKIKPKPPVTKPVVKKELPDDVVDIIQGFVKPDLKSKEFGNGRTRPSKWNLDDWQNFWSDARDDNDFMEAMDERWEYSSDHRKAMNRYYNEDTGDVRDGFWNAKDRYMREVEAGVQAWLIYKKGMFSGEGGFLFGKRRKNPYTKKTGKMPVNKELDGITKSKLMDLILEDY
tara:strand:- start:3592 stop:4392 length:801 start_codon:yes stop_codon:yes gene_type:complete